ncbi:MAG: hypothetical protein ACK5BP_12495, partial [Planctomyces sp.]
MVTRILCLRLPNWPVQAAARRLRGQGQPDSPLALRTRADWTDAGVSAAAGTGRGGGRAAGGGAA